MTTKKKKLKRERKREREINGKLCSH